MIERLPARDYYGPHATGVVVLVNGAPTHFTGPTAAADADKFQLFATRVEANMARDGKAMLTAHRQPTAYEVKFGYGATHYRDFPLEAWVHPDGRFRKWIKADDGLRYYR